MVKKKIKRQLLKVDLNTLNRLMTEYIEGQVKLLNILEANNLEIIDNSFFISIINRTGCIDDWELEF